MKASTVGLAALKRRAGRVSTFSLFLTLSATGSAIRQEACAAVFEP
ncbi:hypothetical protein I6F35_12155 [Bradyrhizobium sp. BRP22]|nr:hypothetical protein [Bradyrhizobium sp. BRP22]MCA1453965.1 hypothetical protein [Bradyrhizobium sp. BRP22]